MSKTDDWEVINIWDANEDMDEVSIAVLVSVKFNRTKIQMTHEELAADILYNLQDGDIEDGGMLEVKTEKRVVKKDD